MCSSLQVAEAGSVHDLATSVPGPELIARLLAVDVDLLSADERLSVVQGWERVAGWVSAQSHRAVAEFAGPADDDAAAGGEPDLCREDLAAALHLGRMAAQTRIDHARLLATVLPGTWELLAAGEGSARHAAACAEACGGLTEEQAGQVEARVLLRAPELTVGELRARLRRAVAVVDPAGFEAAHEVAAAGRGVVLWPEPDGMATVAATLPAADAQTVFHALDAAAHRSADGAGASLPVGARRADALPALATASLEAGAESGQLPLSQGRRRTQVQIVIDPATLLGLAEGAAHLVGYGPIPATVARALAVDGTWQRLVAEPVTGHLLDLGHTTYRPSQELRDYLVARDRTCQFPGCWRPAERSELDHIDPYRTQTHPGQRGPTSSHNMGCLCKRHHQLKTLHGWTLTRQADGSLRWTSRSGRTYDVPPENQWPHAI